MMRELSLLWSSLQDPEYLHLLLEPLPVFGLALGLIFLIAGMAMDLKQMRLLALVVMIASTGSVYWYLKMRVTTEPRVAATISTTFHPLIKEQTARRVASAWIYYVAAAACAVALFAGGGGKSSPITYIVLVIATAALFHATWLHKKECEVYHRNIVHNAAPR